jgi:hypothetical protein
MSNNRLPDLRVGLKRIYFYLYPVHRYVTMVKPLDGPGIFQSMLSVVLFLRDTESTLHGLIRLD